MVKLTKQLSGIVITQNERPVETEILIKPDERVTGSNASNKPWKEKRKRNKANEFGGYKPTKEDYDRKRQERKELKSLMDSMKAEKDARNQRLKEKREAKKKRQEENATKNLEYQVIKDNKRISKWSKRARNKLMKMPKGLYEKYLAKTK